MARNWSSLSPAYRSRLQKGGIDQTAYEAGVSLQSARGHAHTPERPAEALRKPQKYSQYLINRNKLRDQVVAKKKRVFGDTGRFNGLRSRRYVLFGVEGLDRMEQRPPSIAEMKKVMAMSDNEMYQRASRANRTQELEDLTYAFLWYH